MAALMLAVTLAYPGFALLCLTMRRHEHQVMRQEPRQQPGGRRSLPPRIRALARPGGWLLLAASLAPMLALPNPGIGLVAWTGMLAVAATALVLGLAYWPRVAALAGPALSLLAAGFQLAVWATVWAAGGS